MQENNRMSTKRKSSSEAESSEYHLLKKDKKEQETDSDKSKKVAIEDVRKSSTDKGPQEHDQPKKSRTDQGGDSDKTDRTPKKEEVKGLTTLQSSTETRQQEHDQPKNFSCRTEQGGNSDKTDRTPKKEEVRRPTTRQSSTETRQQEHDQPKNCRTEQGGNSDKTDKTPKKEDVRRPTTRQSSTETRQQEHDQPKKCRTEQGGDFEKTIKKAMKEEEKKPTTRKSSTETKQQEHDQPKKRRTEQGGDSDKTNKKTKKEEERKPTTRKSSTETKQQEHDQPKKRRTEQGGDSDKTNKKTKKEEERKPTTRKSSTETRQQEHDKPKKCRIEQGGVSDKTNKKAKKDEERKPTTRKSSTETRQQEHDQPNKDKTEQGGDSDKTNKKTKKGKRKQNFFDEDTPHGLVKRSMYMRYLQQFIASTQQSGHELVTKIYDVSAGIGRYSEEWPSEIEKYGSPLIALHVAIRHFIWKNTFLNKFEPSEVPLKIKERTNPLSKYYVKLHLIEKDSKKFGKLVENIKYLFMFYDIEIHVPVPVGESRIHTVASQDKDFPIIVTLQNDEFSRIKPVLDEMECMTTFIDLFGFSQGPFDKVKDYCGPYKSLYVNFLSSFVNRFLHNDSNRDYVAKTFGMEFKDIETHVSKSKIEKIPRRSALVDLYLNQLKEHNEFKLSFEMRQSQNSPIYDLIFVTNHPKSFISMKEAFNRGTQSYTSKFSFSDFYVVKKNQTINMQNRQDDKDVACVLFEKFKGKKDISINEIEKFLLYETIFVWRKKPLNILQKDARIVKVNEKTGNSSPAKRGTFPEGTEWFISFAETNKQDTK
ncbi:uncharacterized protein LOC143054710 isoform X1 [Mytilus galloprovincialis]|uniref:uncharacterized protein LOC143054710 isoform X1 n=1 Tax=Mytilus galloprovincialis TaxID=29158 RepID=UPI003F7BE499